MFKIEIFFIILKKNDFRQDDDLTEEAIMVENNPSNVSDISDDHTSGMAVWRIKYLLVNLM